MQFFHFKPFHLKFARFAGLNATSLNIFFNWNLFIIINLFELIKSSPVYFCTVYKKMFMPSPFKITWPVHVRESLCIMHDLNAKYRFQKINTIIVKHRATTMECTNKKKKTKKTWLITNTPHIFSNAVKTIVALIIYLTWSTVEISSRV